MLLWEVARAAGLRSSRCGQESQSLRAVLIDVACGIRAACSHRAVEGAVGTDLRDAAGRDGREHHSFTFTHSGHALEALEKDDLVGGS